MCFWGLSQRRSGSHQTGNYHTLSTTEMKMSLFSAQSCLTLCDPMDCSTPGFTPISQTLLKLMSVESVMPSNHLILCYPLSLLTLVFPSIRVFSSESDLCIRWPKYWSFSFSISPFNEYSGLISFRTGLISFLSKECYDT